MTERQSIVARAAAPGGFALDVAKRAAEWVLWTRVSIDRRRGKPRAAPSPQPPTAVLKTFKEWQDATAEAKKLRLPLHHDRPKNWDALGAIAVVLESVQRTESVTRVVLS